MISRTLTMAILAVAVVLAIAAPVASGQALTLPTIEYKCYTVPPGAAVNKPATLTDQFDSENVRVQQAMLLCNPATKVFNGVTFGGETVTIPGTTIEITLPHLKCYKIVPSKTVNERVTLEDQFGTETNVLVTTPQILCTTVTKTVLSGAAENKTGSTMAHSNASAARGADKTNVSSENRR